MIREIKKIVILAAVLLAVSLCWFVYRVPSEVRSLPSSNFEVSTISVSPELLRKHVEKLSLEFVPRDHLHPENLEESALYIQSSFESQGLPTELQRYSIGGKEYLNVIASLGPETSEVIVVGAHYDAAEGTPGADDNASGVAGLLELARILAKIELKTNLQLVAYTLEEPPFFATAAMGSAVHAQSLSASKQKVIAMLSLEMIGFFSDEENSQQFPVDAMRYAYPTTGDFIAVVGRLKEGWLTACVADAMQKQSEVKVVKFNGPEIMPGISFSDHLSYWREDFPALMVTDTAFFRNKNYHEAGDVPDTLDYFRMSKVVEGVFYSIQSLATGCGTAK